MELLYKAYDGEIFNSKEECESYEAKLEAKNFDKDLQRIIYLSRDIDGMTSFVPIEEVKYIYTYDICYIPDEAALRAVRTLMGFKYSNIKVGYNFRMNYGDNDEWKLNEIESLIEERDEINKQIDILEEGVFRIANEISKRKKESF